MSERRVGTTPLRVRRGESLEQAIGREAALRAAEKRIVETAIKFTHGLLPISALDKAIAVYLALLSASPTPSHNPAANAANTNTGE